MPATGNGATLGWASSANVGTITSISGIGGTREAIDTSSLATTGGRDFIPSDLVDYGELSIEGAWYGTTTPIASFPFFQKTPSGKAEALARQPAILKFERCSRTFRR